MTLYIVSCDECGWSSPEIDERAAAKFRALAFCQECRYSGKKSLYKFRERIIIPLKGPPS